MWLSSSLHLQTCNFLLDDVLIEVLIDLINLQTWWFLYPRGWSRIYLVFMKSQGRRKDREKDLENRKGVGLLELLLTFLLSACHLWECFQVLFSSKSFMKSQRKEREREQDLENILVGLHDLLLDFLLSVPSP